MLDSSEPLSDWLPELWEMGEEPDYHLFGCPDCDGLGQVSPSMTLKYNDDDADVQIYHAIAWMWVHRDPVPKMDDLNRADLDRVVQSLIAMRFSTEDLQHHTCRPLKSRYQRQRGVGLGLVCGWNDAL